MLNLITKKRNGFREVPTSITKERKKVISTVPSFEFFTPSQKKKRSPCFPGYRKTSLEMSSSVKLILNYANGFL